MMQEEGGFHAAQDADSEGVEGKFYTWTAAELQELLGEDFGWFSSLYSITPEGNWEIISPKLAFLPPTASTSLFRNCSKGTTNAVGLNLSDCLDSDIHKTPQS